jgi:hypothetical protein
MTTFRCDRCNSPIAIDRDTLASPQGKVLANAPIPLREGPLDLCAACASAFVAWFQAGKGEAS